MTRFNPVVRMRETSFPVFILAPLAVLLLASCSSYGGSSDRPEVSVTCADALTIAVDRVRTDDTGGALNSELDWLSSSCSAEYDVFVDYVSAQGSVAQFGLDSCDSLSQHLGTEAVALLSEDGLCVGGSPGSVEEATVVENQPGGGIAWNEAVNYVGTTQRVCGPFAGTGNSTDDVFLNLGLDYPDPGRFQIVVWDVGAVEPIGYGATLCTSGEVTLYEGVAQIELESAGQVENYE